GKLTRYSTREGLPNDSVYEICYDREGSVWVGTEAGLARFQNERFTTYSKRESILNDAVLAIYEDREGSLWIGAERSGLNRLRDVKFVTYSPNEGSRDA